MAFDNLSDRLSAAFKRLVGVKKLTRSNMEDMIKEVRFALIEADVHPDVVDSFIDNISEKAIGQEVWDALKPSEMVVKIVNDELVSLLGNKESSLHLDKKPSLVMMVGLQGSGKTTSLAKIANYLQKTKNLKVLMIAGDRQRLAAVDQLKVLGQQVGVEVFSLDDCQDLLEVAKAGVSYGKAHNFDVILVDTAGRLAVDEALMQELEKLEQAFDFDDILLSVDAMVGQDIVNVAKAFRDRLALSGLVVTKYDGDARGGGILSVRQVTQVPIMFVGVGEKMDDLELFYPDRIASRILGMGDILTLIEQAQAKMDQEKSEEAAMRMMSGQFSMDDLLVSLEQLNKLGPLSGILKMLPGGKQLSSQIDDRQSSDQLKKTRAIIQSMTKKERQQPSLVRASQKRRIANGAGVTTTDVNRLLNQYDKMKDQMRLMSRFIKG